MGLLGWLGWKERQPEWGVTPTTPPRFDSFDAEAEAYLDKEGYVVLRGLSAEEVGEARALLWDYWEALDDRISRTDASTWGRMDAFMHKDTGIVNSYGIGQSQLLWYVRGKDTVRQAFEGIWDTKELITSFDGGGMFRPWSVNPAWKTSGGWFHADQSLKRKGRVCVQGLVSLYDQTAATGGLTVVPGSQAQHQDFCRATLTGLSLNYIKNDFVPIPARVWVKHGFQPKLVCCSAGDLVLWDSRTVHCNSPALEPDAQQQAVPDFIRAVAYVCMTPRAWATEAALAKRREYVRTNQTSTHWPHEPYAPYNWPAKWDPPQLTEAQQRLV
mmetsp:Transcript_16352/g.41876  ORF Transcript_16352/g.41876 Transcript_16352/m.41876 type:complete len:328 (+) Transcript_16352:201-1184(+)